LGNEESVKRITVMIGQGVQGEGMLGSDGEFSKSTALYPGDQIERGRLKTTEPNFDNGFPDRGGTDVDLVGLLFGAYRRGLKTKPSRNE
jgi:hypothetical protein